AIWGPFPKVVADSLNAIGKKISKSCKAGETPDLDFIHDGKFFGSEYTNSLCLFTAYLVEVV
ncbi:hypothetical protein ACCT20_37235, partial [Rhizobium ruizarguesonis]